MELTTQPFSTITVFTPRRCSSMPQARPVGPAPTMSASKDSVIGVEGMKRVYKRHRRQDRRRYRGLAQFAFQLPVDVFERGVDGRGVLAAAFGHIRPAAALAADRLRDRAHQLAGLPLRGEVLGDCGDDGDAT